MHAIKYSYLNLFKTFSLFSKFVKAIKDLKKIFIILHLILAIRTISFCES